MENKCYFSDSVFVVAGLPFGGVLIGLGFVILYFLYKIPKIKINFDEQLSSNFSLKVIVDQKTKKYETLVKGSKKEYS